MDFRGPEPEPELPPGNRATSGRTEFCQNSGKFLPEFRRNSGCSGTDRNFWRTSGVYITGDSGQDTWHGISRYWTQRPATLGARTQDGFSQAFRCPAAVCWPSPCAVLALYYGYRHRISRNSGRVRPELPPVRCTLLAEFYQKPMTRSQQDFSCTGRIRQNSARTSTCTGTVLMYGTTPPLYTAVRVAIAILEYSSGGILPENRRPEATRMMI